MTTEQPTDFVCTCMLYTLTYTFNNVNTCHLSQSLPLPSWSQSLYATSTTCLYYLPGPVAIGFCVIKEKEEMERYSTCLLRVRVCSRNYLQSSYLNIINLCEAGTGITISQIRK